MFTFEATYDPEGAANAERAFYVRSITELRRWETFGSPILFLVVLLTGRALQSPTWFTIASAAVFALSVLGPLLFYFALPRAARKLASSHTVRQIALKSDGIEITIGNRKSSVAWTRVKHVWDAGGYVLLVLGKFGAISVPRRSLPPGAYEFIVASTKRAA